MKKGITILILTIAIVVMTILAGAIVYFDNNILKTIEKSQFAIELLNIQNQVDSYYLQNDSYPISGTISVNVSGFRDFELEQFSGETINTNVVTLLQLDLTELGITKSEFGTGSYGEDDFYAVSETTGRVYYVAGFEYENEINYTLNYKLYDSNVNESVKIKGKKVKVNDVIFVVSNLEYSNEPITVTVMLPQEATLNNITTTNSIGVGEINTTATYQIIHVNTDNDVGNYDIDVTYTLEGVQKTASYSVKNSDVTAPAISVTQVKQDEQITVITIDTNDNLSGVKRIKYEDANIVDKSYFDKYGVVVENNTVYCYGTEFTVYVVDNVGNSAIYNGTCKD